MDKRDKIRLSFAKYVPTSFVDYVVDLLFTEKVHFKITKPRKTKQGDYRPPFGGKKHRITVNGDLNTYAFLITTLHEFAHMYTYIKYGNNVKTHGKEWKHEFKKLLAPLLTSEEIPEDLKHVLKKSVVNLKASSCTDSDLYRVLKRYDENGQQLLLENLKNNDTFQLGERIFKRGVLRRTRFLCKELTTGKLFLISRLAEVKHIHINK